MKRCLTYGMVFLLYAGLACAQDFDRLFIRPVIESDAFVSGKLTWLSAEDWPTTTPNSVALRSPGSAVVRYTATWPPAAPPEKYCLFIQASGQMSFSQCLFSTASLWLTRGILLDMTDDNVTCLLDRTDHGVSGVDPTWVSFECALNESFSWYVAIPDDLPDEPTLRIWAYSSTSFGTTNYSVKRLCLSPDDGDDILSVSAWDATYTPSHTFGAAGRLSLVEFKQTSWTPVGSDLCWFSIQHTSGASVTQFLFGEGK